MAQLKFDPDNLKHLFREVGLHNPKGEFYLERAKKYKQVFDYIIQVQSALKKLSTKRPIVMLDCGCGKSYLSFILYEYCKTVLNRKIKILGVDNNPELIQKCQKTTEGLNFKYMQFYDINVEQYKSEEDIDIVYSLHACNTATDQMIAKGIEVGARYIFSVSCCQHRNRKLMRAHPFITISRYQAYKERLVDMISDTMRGLLLEHLGYGVEIFEFTAAEYTPKNIMLRAIKGAAKKQDREIAFERFNELKEIFHFTPILEEMLKERML